MARKEMEIGMLEGLRVQPPVPSLQKNNICIYIYIYICLPSPRSTFRVLPLYCLSLGVAESIFLYEFLLEFN